MRQTELWGITLTSDQMTLMERFARLLESYRAANVIGPRSYDRIMEEHVLDSLSCLLVPSFEKAQSMVDVGTGGGFPGIPLKIARPSLNSALLESAAKKIVFVQGAVLGLGLEGVKIINARAEDVGIASANRAQYDVATSRAVSSLAVVAEYCVPLVHIGGQVVAMKGRITDSELEQGKHAASLLGAQVVDVLSVPLLTELRAEERCLVVLEKVQETPDKYPRRPGVARKRPLGSK